MTQVHNARPRTTGSKYSNLLCVVANTAVKVEDVVADEPDEIGEVRGGGSVPNVAQHRIILHC